MQMRLWLFRMLLEIADKVPLNHMQIKPNTVRDGAPESHDKISDNTTRASETAPDIKHELKNVIQSRRLAKGLDNLETPTTTDNKPTIEKVRNTEGPHHCS